MTQPWKQMQATPELKLEYRNMLVPDHHYHGGLLNSILQDIMDLSVQME